MVDEDDSTAWPVTRSIENTGRGGLGGRGGEDWAGMGGRLLREPGCHKCLAKLEQREDR